METVSEQSEAEGLTGRNTPPSNEELTKLKSTKVSVPQPSSRGRASSDGKIRPIGSGRSRSSSGRDSTTSLGGGGNLWTEAELYLTEKTLCYDVEGRTLEVLLEDLIGVQIKPSPPPNKANTCEANIFYFPFITKRFAARKVRRDITLSILFDEKDDFKENLAAASEWKTAILLQTQRAAKCAFEQANGDDDDGGVSDEDTVISRKFLVLINPMAGSQNGKNLFDKHVKPMFINADISWKEVITEQQNHARDMIKTYDFSGIDGIVISSGDGLLYEVINGIMERDDWETTIKTPIGMIPTGSGNALAASTLYESGEDTNVETAAFQIIRGGLVAGDISYVQLSDETSRYMALLANWGLVADVDIESEKFRKIGELRFIIGAITSVMKKRIYRGKLSYLLDDSAKFEMSKSDAKRRVDNGVESSTEEMTPTDQTINIEVTEKEVTVVDDGVCANNVEAASTEDTTIVQEVDVQEVKSKESRSKKNGTQRGPLNDLLVPLSKKVPDSWISKEDNFFGITPLMIPLMAKDFFGNRDLKIGSGFIRIVCIDGEISRRGAIKLVTSADTGGHINMDEVTSVDVKAFRLEPITPGIFTLDGEVVPYGPVQAQIHPKLLRIMCRRRKT